MATSKNNNEYIKNSNKWKYLNNLLNNFCEVYNYKYIKTYTEELDINIEKIYTLTEDKNTKTKFKATANGLDKTTIKVELISFIYRFFEELGIEDLTVKINDKELTQYLTLLDINYELTDLLNNNVFEVNLDSNNYLLAYASENNSINLEFILDDLLELIDEPLQNKKELDVFITQTNEEEKIKALELIQNLRLSGIITEIDIQNNALDKQIEIANSLNTKFLVILNSEDLQKGLINIKDNILQEEFKIDENEILDYLLSNI